MLQKLRCLVNGYDFDDDDDDDILFIYLFIIKSYTWYKKNKYTAIKHR